MTRASGRAAFVALAAAVAVVVPSARAAFLSAADASGPPTPATAGLAIINAERQANGIPPLSLDAQSSAGCLAHDHYLALGSGEGQQTPHEERPGMPGYTTDGATAAQNSDLAFGVDHWAGSNPWDDAPLHLAHLLSPLVHQLGVGNAESYSCAGGPEWPYVFATQDILYSYPSDGRSGVPIAEYTGSEVPDPTPLLGLSAPTGPYLFVFADGPWMQNLDLDFVRASLSAADGTAVAITLLDRSTPHVGLAVEVGTAMIVPDRPLAPKTRYTASVTVANLYGVTLSRTWSFTTEDPNAATDTPLSPNDVAEISSATISQSSFPAAKVTAVSVSFSFARRASFWYYTLSRERAGRWKQIKTASYQDSSRNPLSGTKQRSVASFFAKTNTLPGSYRLTIFCDLGSRKSVTFTITK